jgi:hypothetical protein
MSDNELSLKATFDLQENQLVLLYEVSNRGGRDVYLYNRVDSEMPVFRMDPDVIGVHLDPSTKTVLLFKNLPPPGVLKKVDAANEPPNIPFQTPVRPGTTFREAVHIPLPLFEFNQDRSLTPPRDFLLVKYRYVYFSLGYYWRAEGMREETIHIRGEPVIVTRGGTFVYKEANKTVETERVRLDVPVLEW